MKRILKYFTVLLTALFILSFISCKSIADPLKQSEEETAEEAEEALEQKPEEEAEEQEELKKEISELKQELEDKEKGSLSGWVKDFSTREPIQGAAVTIGEKVVLTDELGNYHLSDIPVGSLEIGVKAESYQDYNNAIGIEKDFSSTLNILLNPETVPSSVSGCLLIYNLSLKENAGNKLQIVLRVRNIKSDSLTLVANDFLKDYQTGEKFLEMVSNFTAKSSEGEILSVEFSHKSFSPKNCYHDYFFNWPLHYEVATIDTKGIDELEIKYEIASNSEIWSKVGADNTSLYDNPEDFWLGYLEWLLYRPLEHQAVCSAKLRVELPPKWKFATVYPFLGSEVDLEQLDYMYGDNVRWKNYQRSNFVLFKEERFSLDSEIVGGVKVQDVYSVEVANQRNPQAHQDQYQYFQYLSDNIGPLPVPAVLTFYTFANGEAIPYLRYYQEAPYGFSHGLRGEYFGTGGGIGVGPGYSLEQIQLWDFNSMNDNKQYSFPIHGTVRYWLNHLIQPCAHQDWNKGGLVTYFENRCVASKYSWEEVVERRFKPMYRYYLEEVAGPPEQDQVNFTGHSFSAYFKPALVFFYINEILKEESEQTKDLTDAMKLLYEDALVGECLSRESLIEALNSLTDYDFTQIVDDYLYGDKTLNLDPWLK